MWFAVENMFISSKISDTPTGTRNSWCFWIAQRRYVSRTLVKGNVGSGNEINNKWDSFDA